MKDWTTWPFFRRRRKKNTSRRRRDSSPLSFSQPRVARPRDIHTSLCQMMPHTKHHSGALALAYPTASSQVPSCPVRACLLSPGHARSLNGSMRYRTQASMLLRWGRSNLNIDWLWQRHAATLIKKAIRLGCCPSYSLHLPCRRSDRGPPSFNSQGSGVSRTV
jgi:hypothetical protein